MLNAIPAAALLLSAQGIVLMANNAIARTLGFTDPKQLIDRYVLDYVAPEIAENRRWHFREAIRTRESIQFEDVHNGRHILNAFYPIVEEDGEVRELATLGQDISKRYQMEEALRRNHPYLVTDTHRNVLCNHISKDALPSSYLCLPIKMQKQPLGLMHLATVADAPPISDYQ